MTFEEFQASLDDVNAPTVSPLFVALWHDARGDWDGAHSIAQDIDDADAALVHAYLHRNKGDRASGLLVPPRPSSRRQRLASVRVAADRD